MAGGTCLELRCGSCHSGSIFPAGFRVLEELLGELYVSPTMTWMTWSGQYDAGRDVERNRLPGPRRLHHSGPGTTWRAVPRRGLVHRCTAGHRMVLTEQQLWPLVRRLPAEATALYLPAVPATIAATSADPDRAADTRGAVPTRAVARVLGSPGRAESRARMPGR